MTLQQIVYFVEVARTQHFTKAAQNLYVSQSSLSHSIQLLEKELEVPLFVRKSGKKVVMTEYADAFLPYCERILLEIDNSKQEIERMRNPMSGTVSVGYSYVNCATLVPDLFNQFYLDNDYEDITVEFFINHERIRLEEQAAQGKLDLVFSCTPGWDGLESVVVDRQDLVVMLPINHPLAQEKSVTVEQIKDEPIICYYHGWNLSNKVEEIFRESGYRPNFTHFTIDWSAQVAMVSLGLGIMISPRLPVDPHLVSVVELDHPLRSRDVYMLWPENRKLSPAAEYVRKYCLDYFRRNI